MFLTRFPVASLVKPCHFPVPARHQSTFEGSLIPGSRAGVSLEGAQQREGNTAPPLKLQSFLRGSVFRPKGAPHTQHPWGQMVFPRPALLHCPHTSQGLAGLPASIEGDCSRTPGDDRLGVGAEGNSLPFGSSSAPSQGWAANPCTCFPTCRSRIVQDFRSTNWLRPPGTCGGCPVTKDIPSCSPEAKVWQRSFLGEEVWVLCLDVALNQGGSSFTSRPASPSIINVDGLDPLKVSEEYHPSRLLTSQLPNGCFLWAPFVCTGWGSRVGSNKS